MIKNTVKLSVTFLLLLIATFSYACKKTNYIDYHRNINEAYYHFYNNEFKAAKIHFEKGMKKVDIAFEKDLLLYAVCLWNVEEKIKAIELLDTNEYTSVGLNPTHYFKTMSDSTRAVVLKRNYQFVMRKVKRHKNSKLYKMIDSMFNEDRSIRIRLGEYMRNEIIDTTVEQAFVDSMVLMRNATFIVLDSIFKIHGYLGGTIWASKVPLRILMLHSSRDWAIKNKFFLFNELKKGHISPFVYARIMDRKLYCEIGKETYYNQWGAEQKKENVSEKDFFKRANSIGLSPYFKYTDKVPGLGKFPELTLYYEYYKKNKKRFNCN